MKSLLFLLIFGLGMFSFAQERPEDSLLLGRMEKVPNEPETIEVPFATIENVPVYKGCDEKLDNEQLKECMSDGIHKFISENFNISIANTLNLKDETVRIIVVFKIGKDGVVSDVRARAPHPLLEKEAIRVVRLIPPMDKPGYQRGKPVIVPYSLPIRFTVHAEDNTEDKKHPIYRSCSENLSYSEQEECTIQRIKEFIQLSIDVELASKLFPQGKTTQFQTDFIIDKKGKVKDVKVQAHNKEMAIHAIHTIKRMPKLKAPGYVDGKPVDTPISFLMTIYF